MRFITAAVAGINVFADACGANGYCSAVGTYYDKSNNSQAFIDSEVGGVWRGAAEVVLPANAVASDQNAQLHSVACPSAGNCSAVGTYSAKASPRPATEGLVVNEVAGVWQRASEVRLPASTNVNPFVLLNQVACGAPGSCSAVGSYVNNSGDQALLLTETSGTWGPGVEGSMPAGANTVPEVQMASVSCASAGNCSAVGQYVDPSFDQQGLLFTETSTLGVRRRDEVRQTLARRWENVTTEWGEVRIKIASMNGTVTNYAPEYEDCRRIATEHGVPLKMVMQEASRQYLGKGDKH